MQPHPEVSVVIPTLNEERAVGRVVEGLKAALHGCEVLVVDSSDDRTAEEALRSGARVIRQPRPGYGRAIRTGFSQAQGRVLVFMDGDATYNPRDLPRVVKPLAAGLADVCIGTRFHSKPQGMPLHRYFGNVAVSLAFSILFLRRVRDTQTGLKAVTREALREMELKEDGMTLSTEVLTRACARGLRIWEEPIGYGERLGFSKNPLENGFRILIFILRERLSIRR